MVYEKGKVKVATDYLFCIIVILMISDAKNIRFPVFKRFFNKIADTFYLP